MYTFVGRMVIDCRSDFHICRSETFICRSDTHFLGRMVIDCRSRIYTFVGLKHSFVCQIYTFVGRMVINCRSDGH